MRGNVVRGNKVGGGLRPLFVIIKKGENVIDDLTNLGTLLRYQVSYLSVEDETNSGTL